MKVEVKPQKPRKQIMQNSFEQAKSRRHLTANVENKWFRDLHENVNPTISNNSKTQNSWFSNLHKKADKQIMQNSFEQAKSRRHLTANVENKWFSDLHENVTPTISNNSKTQNSWFSNLHKNVNSAKSPNVHVPSGILPKPRKRHLSLQRPISLDPFCARMALHIFRNPSEPSHIFTHTDMPPYAPINPAKPSANFSRPRPTIDRATETLP